MEYDNLRHFADSWGLLYLLILFVAVTVFMFRPGAKQQAIDAAQIPLRDSDEGVDPK
ncbi:MAG: cbb3-type cytochrome c oxidase subunit 3 [Devosia sp.]|jgi:cytochrome c oxidase cbb3-type subunit 4